MLNEGTVPLIIPWPVLLIGQRGVHYLHQLILRLAPPQLTLYWHAGSYAITGALRAAAKLRIADMLDTHHSLDVHQLANLTQTHAHSLQRLLLALETIGTFSQGEDGKWTNTPISAYLSSNHPASMRSAVLMLGGEQYVAFSRLDYSVATGLAAFPRVYQQHENIWDYMDHHKQSQEEFILGQHGLSFLVDQAICTDYDFSRHNHVCDIAGGMGAFLRELLTSNRHLSGTLFERLPVIDLARDSWLHSPLVNRTQLRSGDFFDINSIPVACDAYILKQVLHHWNNEYAAIILKNLKSVIEAHHTDLPNEKVSRVLIIDRVMNTWPRKSSFIESHGANFVDLVMLSNFDGAYERGEKEWRTLLNVAGFEVVTITSTRSDFCVIEAVPILTSRPQIA